MSQASKRAFLNCHGFLKKQRNNLIDSFKAIKNSRDSSLASPTLGGRRVEYVMFPVSANSQKALDDKYAHSWIDTMKSST